MKRSPPIFTERFAVNEKSPILHLARELNEAEERRAAVESTQIEVELDRWIYRRPRTHATTTSNAHITRRAARPGWAKNTHGEVSGT